MEKSYPKFTLRVEKSLLQKIEISAKFNSRSKNREIEFALKRYIRDFEALHGDIQIAEE